MVVLCRRNPTMKRVKRVMTKATTTTTTRMVKRMLQM
jgi:hypothetical protein